MIKNIKRIFVAIGVALLLLWGAIEMHNPFVNPSPPAHCIAVDPQDEPAGQDYDSNNCPGVK